MSNAITFSGLVDLTLAGRHPVTLVEMISGNERQDDITDDDVKTREFTRIASQYAAAYPYIGPNWINTIADQVRNADAVGMKELEDMATRNREAYAGQIKMDANGSFQLWDAILRGLLATRTDQVPPVAPLISKPELA